MLVHGCILQASLSFITQDVISSDLNFAVNDRVVTEIDHMSRTGSKFNVNFLKW